MGVGLKSLTLGPLFALCIAAEAPQKARMIELKPEAKASETLCANALKMCFTLQAEGGEHSLIVKQGSGETSRTTAFPVPLKIEHHSDRETAALWSNIIVLPDRTKSGATPNRFLLGVEASEREAYSGGGARTTRLHLFEFNVNFGQSRALVEVLEVAYSSSIMIRACFTEEDYKERKDACHDEYETESSIKLSGYSKNAMPVLTYRSVAKSFPDFARRSEDSTRKAKCRKKPFGWAINKDCSFSRTLTYNPTTRRYEANMAGPECSDFDVP